MSESEKHESHQPTRPKHSFSAKEVSLPICLHPPAALASLGSNSSPSTRQGPSTTWLAGTWYVTHSTLPMWKSKRDVRITYTPLPPSRFYGRFSEEEDEATDRLDDVVTYRSLKSPPSAAPLSVHGIDEATGPGAWDWHGKGWLALFGPLARSHWEVLGWGSVPVTEERNGMDTLLGGQDVWVVTYFAKTLFTPAGVDIYSRHSGRLSSTTVKEIKAALSRIDDVGFQSLVQRMFEIAS